MNLCSRALVARIVSLLFLASLCTISMPSVTAAQDKASVAMVTGISKKLLVSRSGKDIQGKVGMDLFEGDILKTGEGCRAVILLGDGSEIKLNQKTEITIKAYNKEHKNLFIKIGEIFGKFLPQETKVILETPRGVAGIEGTEFTLKVDDHEGMVNVSEGVVSVGDDKKEKVTKDQCCAFKSGTPGKILKAKFPGWQKDIKEYGSALKDIFKETDLGETKKKFDDFTPSELKSLEGTLTQLGKELREIQAPDFMEPFHKELIKINGMCVEIADAALKAKENPADENLKADLQKKTAALKTERMKFIIAVKASVQKWNRQLSQFKQNYGKTLQTRGKFLQQRLQKRQSPQGDSPQEK